MPIGGIDMCVCCCTKSGHTRSIPYRTPNIDYLSPSPWSLTPSLSLSLLCGCEAKRAEDGGDIIQGSVYFRKKMDLSK